jgi:hypothetical protein
MRPASIILLAAALTASTPVIPYFGNIREITPAAIDRQNYVVLDEEIWQHARADVADLRLYRGDQQVPYAIREQRASRSSQEQPARVLNAGRVHGATEFDLDVGSGAEYDRVRLQLDAKNFVLQAAVAGEVEPGRGPRTQLPSTTLYDFSRENLGSNFVLKLPASNFRYLHVRLSAAVQPDEVRGASVANAQETKASWTPVGANPSITVQGRQTVIFFTPPDRVPLDRVVFDVAPDRINFLRDVLVNDGKTMAARGQIARVRLRRNSLTAVSEDLTVDLPSLRSGNMTITVENGDDPPLPITSVRLLSVQRRLYFEADGQGALKLYYGDPKLQAPAYDYIKFFREDAAAVPAKMGPGEHNLQYRGRPDERPWSERHSSVLWIALVVAVGVLAAVALRGFKEKTA